jgi:hypothetical protein
LLNFYVDCIIIRTSLSKHGSNTGMIISMNAWSWRAVEVLISFVLVVVGPCHGFVAKTACWGLSGAELV